MWITLLAFVVGALIGMTGTGSGVVLTPLLLVFTPYPALTVIGSDIVLGTLTRLLGVFEHKRLRQVRWRLAAFLIAGSVPGTIGAAVIIKALKTHLMAGQLDHVLKQVLASILMGVALFLPLARSRWLKLRHALVDPRTSFEALKLLGTGFAVGLLVAVTSIGSGSLMMIFLLLLTPFRAAELVGTDILFGVGTGVLASSLHLWMGHFDVGLVARLSIGAFPGVVIGSRLTRLVPEQQFSWLFSVIYFALGARLLFA
jgi:uncharacterized membrane protein YfcA